MNSTPVSQSTRGRKGSVKDQSASEATASCSHNFSEMLLASEQRLKNFFKDELQAIYNKLHQYETVVSSLQSECVRLDTTMMTMKKVIVEQQMIIEEHEEKLRANNLIIHNVPETTVKYEDDTLDTDSNKVVFMCGAVDVDIDTTDIAVIHRLGKKSSVKPRPIKVVMKEKYSTFILLKTGSVTVEVNHFLFWK